VAEEKKQGVSAQQLIDGILQGKVPRQVRLFAAQGLLPVTREELISLQVVLSADPDPELARIAKESLLSVETKFLLSWLRETKGISLQIDLLVRVVKNEEIWVAAARHPEIADETLRMMARHGGPVVQDVIITNQARILENLEILEDLKANDQATSVVLRRIREFEEEFIEKVEKLAREGIEEEPPEQEVPSIEESLQALKSLGGHIPDEENLSVPEIADPAVEEEAEKLSAFGRILKMSIKDKVLLAMKGSREERAILINSRNRLVLRGVLASPKLTELEIERFAASRSVSDEVIRLIAENRKWLRQYAVVLALAQNPKTPIPKALRLLNLLREKDIKNLAKDRNANPVVRRQAKAKVEQAAKR